MRRLKDGAVLICDDEGKLKGLRPNRRLGGDLIVGTFLIAGVDAEGDFCSLTETQAERWKKELAEPIKNIESLVQLRDLLQIGLPDNTYLVHRDAILEYVLPTACGLECAAGKKSRQHGTMFWPPVYASIKAWRENLLMNSF